MRKALFLATAFLAGATSVAVAQKRPMTIDDLITAVRVSEPQLSPDGKTVAYVRTTTDGTTGKRNADIWSVPADGSAPPKLLIGGEKSESSPRFVPDGRLAFISTRDGAPQVYVANVDGSGAKQVTNLAAGAQAPYLFSSDGTKLVFVSDVYPDCQDEACNKQRAEEAEKNPVKAHRINRLLFRHWTEWRENVRHHLFVTDLATGATRDVTPGDYDSPTYFYEDGAVAFSPDGAEIAFASNREGNDKEAWTTNQDIFVVPASGGTAKAVTSGKGYDVQPVYSPDGRAIVTRSQRRAGFEGDRWYLEAYDRASSAHKPVFETPDLSVEDFAFSRDGRSIYFTAQDKGVVNLYSVAYPTGTPRVVVKGGAISAFEPADGFAIIARSTMMSPSEISRVDFASGAEKALTRENENWLQSVSFSPAESKAVTGAAGAQVQYWLIKPPNFDAGRKYPVVFLIHGGPQGAWEDAWSFRWNPQLWAAQGYVIAAPNPRGSTGFGQKFVDEISQDWGGKVMTDLNAVFDDVAKMPFVDPQKMGIAGASYGGYAVNWIIGHTDRFKVAVTHDGVFNAESMALVTEELWFPEWEFGGPATSTAARANFEKWSPHRFAQNIKTPTLVVTNELDYRVPVDQGIQLFTALRRNGVPSEMLIFPDEGHWVLKALNSRAWHQAVFGWIKKYIGADSRS
ncbi:MAG: prolyl oligopeptidase family serine peptidase [Acidobacteriota bacterium]